MTREMKKSEASLNSLKTSKDQQLKHSEIHSKIQRQRQEMLLVKQKNLNEFRNQLKLEHERSRHYHAAQNESNIELEDECRVVLKQKTTATFTCKIMEFTC